MQTINDIKFDDVIYRHATIWSLILYAMEGTHIAIPLDHAHLMPFIQPFTNVLKCKNHIDVNNQKTITLFTYEKNMQWLITNSYFISTPQLQKINIFCSLKEDQEYWTTWSQRYRHKIEEPFSHKQLDKNLLFSGLNHILAAREQFHDDHGVLNRLKEDDKNIRSALSIYFRDRMDTEDERIREGEEPQT